MKPFAWQISITLSIVLLTFNAAAQGNGPFSTAEGMYEALRQKGLEALKNHDTQEATARFEDALQTAKDNKERGQKREARGLLRKTEKDYGPFFKQLEKAEPLAALGEYKKATAELNRALNMARELPRHAIYAAHALDQQLYNQALELKSAMDEQRIEAFQEAKSSGLSKLSTGSPEEALSLLEYARSQMDGQEARQTDIASRIKEAHYQIWLQEGDYYLDQRHYELALHFYEKARNFAPRYDNSLDNHIRQAQQQLAGQHLTAADGLYRQGAHTLSAKAYRHSQQYEDSYEVENRRSAGYNQSMDEGERALKRGAYHEARIHFKNALYFLETTAAEDYLREADKMISYLSLMEKGRALLWENKVDEASRCFQEAASQNSTGEVTRLIRLIEDYLHHLDLGNAALGKNQPEEAIGHFKEAQRLIYTPEASKLISKTATLYADVTVVLAPDVLLKMDASQAVIYLKKLSQQGDGLQKQEYRHGKAYFYALEPGDYTVFVRGLKGREPGTQRLPLEEEYSDTFTLKGGTVELLLSASGVEVAPEKFD